MASMVVENERVGGDLKTSREPVGPKRAGDKGSLGDQALMDAIVIVVVAWLVVFFLAFSLRSHNL